MSLRRAGGKTLRRSARYLAGALAFRPPWREQAPVAWGFVAGALWLGAGDHQPARLIPVCALLAVLVAVAAIDAGWGIIPDSLTLAVLGLGIAGCGALGGAEGVWPAVDGLAGAALAYAAGLLLHRLHRALRGYDGFGLGDVKLVAAGTVWIGFGGLADMILVAVASALASLAILRWQGPLSRRDAIPFGPHLALGLFLVVAIQPVEFSALLASIQV